MAKIQVNTKMLSGAVDALESYCSQHKVRIQNINSSIDTLRTTWKGSDSDAMHKEWEKMKKEKSEINKIKTVMSSYADLLRFSIANYLEAQEKAQTEAAGLK